MVNKKIVVLFMIFLFLFCCFSPAVYAEEREVTQTLIAEITPTSWIPESMTISPDGKHWAFVMKKNGKELVVIDGKENKEYELILKGAEGYIAFSPNSERVIYFAGEDGKQFAVIDGKEGNRYEKAFIEKGSMIFSPDNKKTAYVAGDGDQQFVVLDGKEGERYGGRITTITFSPDGKREYYIVHSNNKEFIVIDGKESEMYNHLNKHILPYFSSDSKRIAYSALKGRKWVAVIDGIEGPEYDDIFFGGPLFSPDCSRVAYSGMIESGPLLGGNDILDWNGLLKSLKEHNNPVDRRVWDFLDNESKYIINSWEPGESIDKKSKKSILYGLNRILDNKSFYEVKSFKKLKADWMNKFILKKMAKRAKNKFYILRLNRFLMELAYPTEIAKSFRYFSVVDGKEGKKYDLVFVGQLSPSFSANSKSFACLVRDKGKWFFVTDGIEGKKYDLMFVKFKIISPDNKRMAYMAVMGGKYFTVINGKEGKKYDRVVMPVMFSPDSKRTTYTALSGDKAVVVVDGKESKKYDFVTEYILSLGKDGRNILYNLEESYDNPPRYIASCNTKWKMKSRNLFFCVARFSPDSKKVIYVAGNNGKLFVVENGKEGKKYDAIKTPPLFSSDSKFSSYTAVDGDTETVVIGEGERGKYDTIFNNREKRSVFFNSPHSFHFFARKNGKIYMVKQKIK
ncbi:MAG: hypothetical protein K8T10_03395 [Candidatus Eremiobacteraeota bacterium]|nr:hypothetical protein [Candidatus Eremiobacteraeota bacterium]